MEISPAGELLVRVKPDPRGLFEYIYRTATGVRWDQSRRCFVAPRPREWSYADWFRQVVADAESELGVRLRVTADTEWVDVPATVQQEILATAEGDAT